MPKDEHARKRMVVEEVSTPAAEPLEEIKEKVEELQDITENISENLEKSEEVQEELAEAVEEVAEVEVPAETEAPEAQPEPKAEPEEIQTDIVPELKRSDSTNPLVIIVPGIFLLGALLGGIYFYQKSLNAGIVPVTSPTPAVFTGASPAASATPAAKLDLTQYPVNVMNGSGTPGEAGKVKTLVEAAGFKVSATGNATSYDFTKTVIKAKADVPEEFLKQLSATLSKTYEVDANQTLAASSTDKVQIIVGSSKAK